jgi:tRNA(fMet)-specific endonuclease VapC
MFLLDTDHIGIIQRRTEPEFGRLWQRIGAQSPALFYTSIVSFHEQVLGWNSYLNRARDAAGVIRGYGMLERILADFAAARVLPFDAAAAGQFTAFRSGGVRIGTLDLRIAAIAVARGLIVLTRNVTDFRQVPGLRVEDWTA